MARSSWKGFLRLSLVSIPVKGYTANRSGSEVRLNQLHKECNSRIKYQKTCPIHGEVAQEDIVSGYEFAKGQFVVIDPEEIEQLRTPKDRAISIDAIVKPNQIDDIYLTEKTYYLVPDGAVGQKPFALVQKCLADEGLEAVARVVMFGREEVVLVRAVENLLAMTALKYDAEVTHASVVKDEVVPQTVDLEELTLTKTLVKAFEKKEFDIAKYKDEYQEKLTKLIESKVEGKQLVSPPSADEPTVINLMDALKRSVAAAQGADAGAAAEEEKPGRKMAASKGEAKPAKGKRKSG